MSHAAVATDQHHQDPVIPVEKTPFGITNGKFGMWMFLCQDCMGFVGLFAAYAALRALADKWYDPNEVLGIWFTALMTFVLICSSVTMVLALDACQRDDQKGLKKWLGLTILGGVFFLGGQVYEYSHLLSESWRLPSGHNFWASFYALTSFHGLHPASIEEGLKRNNGIVATAMHCVNAIPYVCSAQPGIKT